MAVTPQMVALVVLSFVVLIFIRAKGLFTGSPEEGESMKHESKGNWLLKAKQLKGYLYLSAQETIWAAGVNIWTSVLLA